MYFLDLSHFKYLKTGMLSAVLYLKCAQQRSTLTGGTSSAYSSLAPKSHAFI